MVDLRAESFTANNELPAQYVYNGEMQEVY